MDETVRSLRAQLRSVLIPALLTIVLAVGSAFAASRDRSGHFPAGIFKDFNAFYCAGAAVNRGADPYLAEPIGSCEAAAKPWGLYRTPPHLVYPAPLPGYALGFFGLLACLPYGVAAAAWTVLLSGAFWTTVAATRALLGGPLVPLVAAYALVDGYASFALGQVAPFAVLGIVLAAWAGRADRSRVAVLGIGLAAIEPHLALPAALSLLIRRPRLRVPLVLLAVGLAAVSLGAIGPERNAEYFLRVLPAHTAAETANEKQFSLTHAAWRLGLSESAAARGGDASYALMTLLGILCAGSVARRMRDGAYLVAVPSLFLLVGGPFVHIVQMAAAIPAALLLHRHAETPAERRLLGVAIAALAVPWVQFVNLGDELIPIVGATTAVLAWQYVERTPAVVGAAAIGSAALLAGIASLAVVAPADNAAALAAVWDPRALAEVSWRTNVLTVGTVDAGAYLLAKAPTWAGLLIVVGCAIRRSRSVVFALTND